ncbi:MAG: c-type cytochrome [Candidatus Acidiferrales bacterium]
MRFTHKWFSTAVMVAVFSLFGTSLARAQDKSADIYKSKCAACHAPDGSGSTPVGRALKTHAFGSPEVQKESDADLIAVITKGRNKMPSYQGKLSADEIKQLVAYIRGLAKKT